MATTPKPIEDDRFVVVLINQERDTKDFGWWDADGPVPNVDSSMNPAARKAVVARRESAHRIWLGSIDDRASATARSPRSEPIPVAVFKRIATESAQLRAYLKSTPARVTRELYREGDDLSSLLDEAI